jgi:hypothetical protein
VTPKPITTNTLFYGDNLPILREYTANGSVALGHVQASAQSRPAGRSTTGAGVIDLSHQRWEEL